MFSGARRHIDTTSSDTFRSVIVESNLETLPSCERQAYGETVFICASIYQSQVPK